MEENKTVFCVSNSPLTVVLIALIMSYAFQFKLQQYIMTLRSLQILHQRKLLVLESMILNTSQFVKTNYSFKTLISRLTYEITFSLNKLENFLSKSHWNLLRYLNSSLISILQTLLCTLLQAVFVVCCLWSKSHDLKLPWPFLSYVFCNLLKTSKQPCD